MRVSFFSFFLPTVLLCGTAGVGLAADHSQQVASSRFRTMSGIVLPEEVEQELSDPAAGDRIHPDASRGDKVTCYTVQRYRVKRQSPDSDAVEPGGYSTCLAASKYGVKTADEAGKTPSR